VPAFCEWGVKELDERSESIPLAGGATQFREAESEWGEKEMSRMFWLIFQIEHENLIGFIF